jgi:quercetin dioxygenase-like cupin family protein
MVLIDRDDFERRIIEPADFVADTEAFVDVRIARSRGKASYSFIGPGVSQNADQKINLTERHGFNVGAASMPSGVINNPHLHYTAEVFICTRGKWRMRLGIDGDQILDLQAGDVFSIPTWVFRGFENIGDDDGWIFAVLGDDDTGGVVWAPHILEEAAETGMYLDLSGALLDANAGDDIADIIRPLSAVDIDVESYSDVELEARRVSFGDLDWSDSALLSSVVGYSTRIAPVIGHGLTQRRRQSPPITNPHTFSLEWLEVAPGSSTGLHRHDHPQATFLVEGDFEVSVNLDSETLSSRPATGSVVSTPAGAWRDFANVGTSTARALLVCGTNEPTRIEWSPDIAEAARRAGFGIDRAGDIAPVAMLGARR